MFYEALGRSAVSNHHCAHDSQNMRCIMNVFALALNMRSQTTEFSSYCIHWLAGACSILVLRGAAWMATGTHPHLFGGFNRAAAVSVLCLMGLGLACGVILRYLDNVSAAQML
eukprot:4874088-Amphidinium_carterae.6